MGKFKRTDPYSRLTTDMKIFIVNKVNELGSLKKVKALYDKKTLVDRYALSMAEKIYKGGGE